MSEIQNNNYKNKLDIGFLMFTVNYDRVSIHKDQTTHTKRKIILILFWRNDNKKERQNIVSESLFNVYGLNNVVTFVNCYFLLYIWLQIMFKVFNSFVYKSVTAKENKDKIPPNHQSNNSKGERHCH